MKSRYLVLALALVAFFPGCGGGSSATPAPAAADTRTVAGALSGSVAANIAVAGKAISASPTKVVSADSCVTNGTEICNVIATATDASTVSDSTLSDCRFSLPLVVGKKYVISLVGPNAGGTACDTFVATIIATSGSIFDISSGSEVDIGDIVINANGTATCSGADSSGLVGSCAASGYADSDLDGVCDWSDGEVPSSSGERLTTCTNDSNCASGEYCSVYGYCWTDEHHTCTVDADCGDGYACSSYNECLPSTSSGTSTPLAVSDLPHWYLLHDVSGCADNSVAEDHAPQYLCVWASSGSGLALDIFEYAATGGCNSDITTVTPTVSGETFIVDAFAFSNQETCFTESDAGTLGTLTFSRDVAESKIQLVRQITNSSTSTALTPVGCSLTYLENSPPIMLQAK